MTKVRRIHRTSRTWTEYQCANIDCPEGRPVSRTINGARHGEGGNPKEESCFWIMKHQDIPCIIETEITETYETIEEC